MSSNSNFETVIKWIVVIILAVVALKVIATVLGIAFFLGGFLLWRVLPLVLVAWVLYKVIEWLRSDRSGSSSSMDI